MKKVLISVVGPTAIGKTKLAIHLAKHFNTEIISADSRQFYKEMQIGTAVPSKEELSEVKHHCIQHKSIHDDYTVGDFEKEALKILENLYIKNDIVVMVGGSGLYIDAITKGLDVFPKINPEIRVSLNKRLDNDGLASLQEQLKTLDYDYYQKVDLANPHRVIRALEVCLGSGNSYSSYLNQEKTKRSFKVISMGLTADRELIYNRINQRVDKMISDGLLDEAKSLLKHKDLNALQTVGYRELMPYFDDLYDLDFAIEEIKKNTRRFAKRQGTWFRKNKEVHWVDYDYNITEVITALKQLIS